jgi:hypothetical protein
MAWINDHRSATAEHETISNEAYGRHKGNPATSLILLQKANDRVWWWRMRGEDNDQLTAHRRDMPRIPVGARSWQSTIAGS